MHGSYPRRLRILVAPSPRRVRASFARRVGSARPAAPPLSAVAPRLRWIRSPRRLRSLVSSAPPLLQWRLRSSSGGSALRGDSSALQWRLRPTAAAPLLRSPPVISLRGRGAQPCRPARLCASAHCDGMADGGHSELPRGMAADSVEKSRRAKTKPQYKRFQRVE